MPSILFIILSCGIIKLQGLHPAIIANLALILTIDKIFFSYRKEKVLSVLFDASLILSVGSLFYFDIIFFVIIIWTGLIILRTFNWREWVITITGLITPYILVFSYYYIFDDINYIREIIVSNVFVSRTDPGLNMSYYIFFSYLLLLIIISTVSMFVRFGLKKISTRKYFTIILWLFLFSMIFLAVLRSMSIEVLVIAAVPASYLLSNYFISLRSRWWGDILFLVLIGLIIYIQVVN